MKKILICDETHPSIFPMLDEIGFTYDYLPKITRPEILEIITQYEGLIIRSKTFIDAQFLDKATNLQFIGRAGAGLDLIDLQGVTKKNIKVFAANEGNRDALAEHCMGMILTLFNKINIADTQVRKGIWLREANRGEELKGKTIGLIGYGNMGKAFAQRLSGFGVKVWAYDKLSKNYSDKYAKEASMKQIFEEADVLSLHIPLTEATRNLVNQDFINRFKKPFFLINSSRGEVAELEAIVAALQSGKLKGACLDVLENEKLDRLTSAQQPIYEALFQLENVILTPHIAGWTHESYVKINEVLVEKILEFDLKRKIQVFAQNALTNTSEYNWLDYGLISTENANQIFHQTGLDLSEYTHTLDSSFIQHTFKNHGSESEESKKGQIAVTNEDFNFIPSIISNFDFVEKTGISRQGLQTIQYCKKIGDTYYYVVEVRQNRKKLVTKTMFKKI